jgi:hypothetical protein
MDKKNDTYQIYFVMKKNLDPALNTEKIDLSKLCVKKPDGTTHMLVTDTSEYTPEQSDNAGFYYVETSTMTEGSGEGAISYAYTLVRIYLTQTDGEAAATFLAGCSGEIALVAQDGWYVEDEAFGTGGEKSLMVDYKLSFSNTSLKPVLCYVYTDEDGHTEIISAAEASSISSLYSIDNKVVKLDLYSEAFTDFNIPTTGYVVSVTDIETLKVNGLDITDDSWIELPLL